MDVDAENLKETSQPHASSGSDDAALGGIREEQSQRLPGTAAIGVDKAEPEQPLRRVRTLGKIRFRPADDEEPQ